MPAEGAPPTPLPLELLTALRILSREHSGLDDLLCAEGVGVVLKKAGLRGGAAQSGFGEKEKLEIDSEWAHLYTAFIRTCLVWWTPSIQLCGPSGQGLQGVALSLVVVAYLVLVVTQQWFGEWN